MYCKIISFRDEQVGGFYLVCCVVWFGGLFGFFSSFLNRYYLGPQFVDVYF